MKTLKYLSAVFLILGVIIAFVPKNTTRQYKLTAEQLLLQIKTGTQFITPDEIADKIIKKDPTLQLIDVRSRSEFVKFNLPGAINIPLLDILNSKNTEQWEQDVKINVLYSNGNTDALEAWMLLRQLGHQNVFVLQGGLNYWTETIMNPQAPKAVNSNDEIAKYNFRKGAGMVLGGGTQSEAMSASQSAGKPKTNPAAGGAKKKKGAAGGCS